MRIERFDDSRAFFAAVAPYLGVNAADAVTVAQVAIGLMRQHLAPGQMLHGIVTDGGQATNVIPARAELRYTMRAANSESLHELEDKMAGCFAAGSVGTGASFVAAFCSCDGVACGACATTGGGGGMSSSAGAWSFVKRPRPLKGSCKRPRPPARTPTGGPHDPFEV